MRAAVVLFAIICLGRSSIASACAASDKAYVKSQFGKHIGSRSHSSAASREWASGDRSTRVGASKRLWRVP